MTEDALFFIVATKHIDHFDIAIRRPGRFDLILQILPPRIYVKLKSIISTVETLRNKLQFDMEEATVKAQLSALTLAEFNILTKALETARNSSHVQKLIKQSNEDCTLRQPATGSGSETWEDVCKKQSKFIRLPEI